MQFFITQLNELKLVKLRQHCLSCSHDKIINRSNLDNTPIIYCRIYFEIIHLCKFVQYYDYSFVLPASLQMCNFILMCSIIYIKFVDNSFEGLLIKSKPFLFAYQCLVQQVMVNRYTIMNTILSFGLYVVLAKIHSTLLVQTYNSKHHTLSHETIFIVYQSVNVSFHIYSY